MCSESVVNLWVDCHRASFMPRSVTDLAVFSFFLAVSSKNEPVKDSDEGVGTDGSLGFHPFLLVVLTHTYITVPVQEKTKKKRRKKCRFLPSFFEAHSLCLKLPHQPIR